MIFYIVFGYWNYILYRAPDRLCSIGGGYFLIAYITKGKASNLCQKAPKRLYIAAPAKGHDIDIYIVKIL